MKYLIYNPKLDRYWHNGEGWGLLSGATPFAAEDKLKWLLPIDGQWALVDSASAEIKELRRLLSRAQRRLGCGCGPELCMDCDTLNDILEAVLR